MALKKCKECGKSVSSKAKACPSCGVPKNNSIGLGAGCLVIIIILLIVMVCSGLFTDDLGKNTRLDVPHNTLVNTEPYRLVQRWKAIGFQVDIPWKLSAAPGPDYSYISQCRGHVGQVGSTGNSTEITSEVLGHSPSDYHEIAIGIEFWNPESQEAGYRMAMLAVEQIGVSPPDEVVDAFHSGTPVKLAEWEVANESTETIREIRLYYRPSSMTSN